MLGEASCTRGCHQAQKIDSATGGNRYLRANGVRACSISGRSCDILYFGYIPSPALLVTPPAKVALKLRSKWNAATCLLSLPFG